MTHGFVHWYMCIFVYTYINIILYLKSCELPKNWNIFHNQMDFISRQRFGQDLKSCKPMSNIDIVSGLMS